MCNQVIHYSKHCLFSIRLRTLFRFDVRKLHGPPVIIFFEVCEWAKANQQKLTSFSISCTLEDTVAILHRGKRFRLPTGRGQTLDLLCLFIALWVIRLAPLDGLLYPTPRQFRFFMPDSGPVTILAFLEPRPASSD